MPYGDFCELTDGVGSPSPTDEFFTKADVPLALGIYLLHWMKACQAGEFDPLKCEIRLMVVSQWVTTHASRDTWRQFCEWLQTGGLQADDTMVTILMGYPYIQSTPELVLSGSPSQVPVANAVALGPSRPRYVTAARMAFTDKNGGTFEVSVAEMSDYAPALEKSTESVIKVRQVDVERDLKLRQVDVERDLKLADKGMERDLKKQNHEKEMARQQQNHEKEMAMLKLETIKASTPMRLSEQPRGVTPRAMVSVVPASTKRQRTEEPWNVKTPRSKLGWETVASFRILDFPTGLSLKVHSTYDT